MLEIKWHKVRVSRVMVITRFIDADEVTMDPLRLIVNIYVQAMNISSTSLSLSALPRRWLINRRPDWWWWKCDWWNYIRMKTRPFRHEPQKHWGEIVLIFTLRVQGEKSRLWINYEWVWFGLFGFPLTWPLQAGVQTSRPALHTIILTVTVFVFHLVTWPTGVTRAAAVKQLLHDHDHIMERAQKR